MPDIRWGEENEGMERKGKVKKGKEECPLGKLSCKSHVIEPFLGESGVLC